MAGTITERVQDDLKTAMKDRDADRTRALRMIRAKLIELAKDGSGAVTDERAMDALRSLRKQRVESAELYKTGGRPELAADEEKEIAVIDGYLPKVADEAQTRAWVKEAIASTGAKSQKEVGKVMGAVMKAHKAEVDGALVKTLATAELPPG